MVAATVGDLMGPRSSPAHPTTRSLTSPSKMHDSDVTHMPVVDDKGALVGIIARGDIVRRVADTT